MKDALDFGEAVKEAKTRRQSMLGHFPTPSDGDQQHQHQHQHKIPNQTNLEKQQSVPPPTSPPPPPPPQDVEQGLDVVPAASTSSTTPHDGQIRVLRLPHCPTNIKLQDNKNITDSSSQPPTPPTQQMTEIIPECCICLNDFQSNHVICWSPEGLCSHSFHEECIVKWFLAVCERTEASTARRRRGSSTTTTTNTTRRSHDVVVECNLQCPVCRQDFITVSETTSSESSHSQQQQEQQQQ
eukprot:CAMPEP_0176502146 /NCGR_PEP_ID=MMETSP0200_2-20121128/14585_1 /TAXON_ID=947934 /ORGANISM="Chaetoceros sp., Strain GSL56" /LENGTH=239 /DNA_ID=CAMNT_0017901173 /DNA_START=790 /DNA_END=1509 /DNA_ORIENTATION=+